MKEIDPAELKRVLSEEEVAERASRIDRFFVPDNFAGKNDPAPSPSGLYTLEVESYTTGKGSWNFTQGIVKEKASGEILFRIRRNYSSFWHAFVRHPNRCEYLLCGRDYQGYTVANLTRRTERTILTGAALQGWGWCWADCAPSPDGTMLAVEGCCWACPYDLLIFDFSNPEALPLPELATLPLEGEWDDNGDMPGNLWLDSDRYQYQKYTGERVSKTEKVDGEDLEYDEFKTEPHVWDRRTPEVPK